MIKMLDLYFQYVVWLNQTLLNGIKWLIANENAYYIFMCSIPILATIITAVRGQLMTSIDGHKEPTTEQIKEAIDTLGNATEKNEKIFSNSSNLESRKWRKVESRKTLAIWKCAKSILKRYTNTKNS